MRRPASRGTLPEDPPHIDKRLPAMADKGERTDPDAAWAPWTPGEDAGGAWSAVHAGHLHRRAGFGADWEPLRAAERSGPEAAVDGLVRPSADADAFDRRMDEMEALAGDAPDAPVVRSWWLRRMVETPHPLLEKATLFWHGFFGVGMERLPDPSFFPRHLRTVRRHALGRFDEMLRAVLAEPAIYAANGAEHNRKAKPSLGFARRLLENWTVGPGAFSERDVSETARAFTGWTVRRGELVFVDREYDAGAKTVFGDGGAADREALVGILLRQPALARQIVGRLYRCFVSEGEEPGEELVLPLAQAFSRDFDLSALLATIFRSKHFYSAAVRRSCVKSPVEFAVGLLRSLEGGVPGIQFGGDIAALGQDLCEPPTSRGWFGGRFWIDPATLAGRANLAHAMLSGAGDYQGKIRLAELARKHGIETPERGVAFLAELLLQGEADGAGGAVREALEASLGPAAGGLEERMAQTAYRIATLPEFQLS